MTLPRIIRAVVADDEPAARQRIVRLLRRHADVAVVGVCESGDDTLTAVRSLAPDVLLLDIQMPGLDGFDVIRGLEPASLPLVVFVTAHDRYALRAFEVRALDYLLKPFDETRFDQCIAWVRAHLDRRQLEAVRERLASLVRADAPARALDRAGVSATRVAIKCDGAVRFVSAGSITHVTAEGCYARVHTTSRSYLIRESLGSLSARLPADVFARVHRSTIINLDAVTLIEPLAHGEARLTLADGLTIKVSRNYRKAVASLRATATATTAPF